MRWNAFVRGAWRQLPVETVIVAAAAVGAIGLHHRDDQAWFARLVLAALVAAPLAFAAHRLERWGRRVPVIAGGVAAAGALAAVWAALPSLRAGDQDAFRYPYLLALLAAVLVPFVRTGPPFHHFVRRFFEQTTTWGVLCGAGIAALRIVAFAIEELFDLRIDSLATDAAIVVAGGFALVYLHRLRADDPASRGRMPELWRRLATMVGAPFVSTMLVILVAYEIAARVRGELPRNVLSPLIMAAGLVGFVSTLIAAAVLDESIGTSRLAPADPHRWARRWTVRLSRAFPVVLLALLPMAWWALWIRIGQHGVTPFRAVRGMGLVCLTCLSVVGSLRWWRGRAALSWEVPAAIIGFTLVAAFGPLGVVPLSIRSQAGRVARILDAAGAGRVVAEPPARPAAPAEPGAAPDAGPAVGIMLPAADYDELEGALRRLAELGGEPAVRTVLRGATADCARPWQASACLRRLGVFRLGTPEDPSPSGEVATYQAHGRFSTSAGDVELLELERRPDEPDAAASSAGEGFRLGADRLVLHAGGAVVGAASLAGLIVAPGPDHGLPSWTRTLLAPDGGIVADLAIERLELWRPAGRAPQIVRLTAIVVWPRREN